VRPGAAPDGTGHRPLGGGETIRPHQRHPHVRQASVRIAAPDLVASSIIVATNSVLLKRVEPELAAGEA